LILYCQKKIDCEVSILNDSGNVIGVLSVQSMVSNLMLKKQASVYPLPVPKFTRLKVIIILIKNMKNYNPH